MLDTGIFDEDRYWIVEAHYAKADPFDVLLTVQVTNAGAEKDTLHVLPTAWYRNTWAWEIDASAPELRAPGGKARVETEHPFLGALEIVGDDGPDGEAPELLFCDNETNDVRLFGVTGRSPYPKDGINDHVVSGAATVNPARKGTKAAFHYRVTVAPGETVELRLRLRPRESTGSPWTDFSGVVAARRGEADEFYGELTPPACSDDEANVMRQAFAGMLWGKQLYYYDVQRWLTGDPTQPPPPESRHGGRNAHWVNFEAFDIMSMPDPWEYPWFAAWDMAFHCVALAHVDPAFAKYQLSLLCREWFQHPNGALPAYEWAFGDVNPPVQAWAAMQVFAIDGGRDVAFLSQVFDKLLVNFTWWVNRLDADGSNIFEGGFLGLDNIGPIDRSHLPSGYVLEQADATGWMAAYALTMAVIAAVLNRTVRPAADLIVKFLEHFSLISEAVEEKGLWNEEDGFYYDQLRRPDGSVVPIRVRSMVGVLPLIGVRHGRQRGGGARAHDGEALREARRQARRAPSRAGRDGRRQRPHAHRRRWHRPPDAGVRAVVRRRGVPVALRAACSVALAPRAPVPPRHGRVPDDDRLRARRVHHRHVRRQLQLARAGVVPRQLPRRRRDVPLCAVLRRRPEARVPDRIRRAANVHRDRRGSARAA